MKPLETMKQETNLKSKPMKTTDHKPMNNQWTSTNSISLYWKMALGKNLHSTIVCYKGLHWKLNSSQVCSPAPLSSSNSSLFSRMLLCNVATRGRWEGCLPWHTFDMWVTPPLGVTPTLAVATLNYCIAHLRISVSVQWLKLLIVGGDARWKNITDLVCVVMAEVCRSARPPQSLPPRTDVQCADAAAALRRRCRSCRRRRRPLSMRR